MRRGGRQRTLRFRPEKMGDFLEAAYCLETDDQTWLAEVVSKARAVWGRGGSAHAVIYDATDVGALRVRNAHSVEIPDEGVRWLGRALNLFTPDYVARSFRSLLTGNCSRKVSSPELLPFFDGMATVGCRDHYGINGLAGC